MGATAEGEKHLLAVQDGYRDPRKRAVVEVAAVGRQAARADVDPKLATGDGALGFWKALPQVFPATRPQRCWVHKTANVLDKLPKRLHREAKDRIHQIWMAPGRKQAHEAFDHFIKTYQAKYPQRRRLPGEGPRRAADVLRLPRRALGPPADHQPHRKHVRHCASADRQDQGLRLTPRHPDDGLQARPLRRETLATLNGHELIGDVIAGIAFTNGVKTNAA